jgi:hypothetical protein
MRRAIAKQSRVRTAGTKRPPPHLKQKGRAVPGLSAVPNPRPNRRFGRDLHHVHAAHAARHAGTGRLLLGGLGDDRLGREDVLRDRGCVL